MRYISILFIFLISTTIAQDIENLNKRELRELANSQKKQIIIKNSQINDQVYLLFNFHNYGNDLEKLGINWTVSSSYESKLTRYNGSSYTQTANIDSPENRLMDNDYDNKTRKYIYFPYEDSDYYLECDRM